MSPRVQSPYTLFRSLNSHAKTPTPTSLLKIQTMMIGEPSRLVVPSPNLHNSQSESDDSLAAPPSPSPFPIQFYSNAGAADYSVSIDSSILLHSFLSNDFTLLQLHTLAQDFENMPIDAVSSDYFHMFEFKIRKCARGGSHDWTHCPYARPGEKARRRDPRKFHYSATPCPDFRHANCKKGDSCDFAHGVFECWLHPSRYRTQLCKDATNCRRRVCFFAHTPDQLRVLTRGSAESSDGSSIPPSLDSSFVSSPTSVINSPLSPGTSQYAGKTFNAMSGMRNVQLDSSRMSSGFGSPRGLILRPGFFSLPSTPTSAKTDKSGPGMVDLWDRSYGEEAPMERVESGRDLRAKIYAKLSKENSFGLSDAGPSAPDFGWVSELVK